MQEAVIVIPIYKEELGKTEKASLKRCLKILGKYPISFICPKSLNVENYQEILSAQNRTCDFIRFDDEYFKSVQSYSKFMLKTHLYNKFLNYNFMLVYQLDAWVFEDSLKYWCEQNYDYIGAPWFEGFDKADGNSPLMDLAGNGGLSLRKISKIKKLLKTSYKPDCTFKKFFNRNKKHKLISNIINAPFLLIKYIFHVIKTETFWSSTEIFEDITIVQCGPKVLKKFNVAPPEIALKFSFEAQPKRLYKMNDKKLPFACHAFEKYDFDFWKQFINID